MRILHVTECFDGGVSRAILAMVRNSAQHDHLILFSGSEAPDPRAFRAIRSLPYGLIRSTQAVRDAVEDLKPDVVHAHSSWAGVYTRLRSLPVPVVYEPHCFVFDDPARSRPVRTVYWMAEAALSLRSKRIVTLTPHERRMARNLRPWVKTTDMVNVPSIRVQPEAKSDLKGDAITMIGRIVPQKDPEFFARTAQLVHRELPGIRFVWVGDGDSDSRRALEEQGVEVTGWLSGEEVVRRLGESRVYLHSASYEGFPLSVLDAAEAHVPTIVRDLPCFEGLDLRKVNTPEEAAEVILAGWADDSRLQSARDRSERLAQAMHPAVQAAQLEELYNSVSGCTTRLDG